MENTGRTTSWERIQRGVKDTERLIGQKQYNMAMVKARQTLEYMVRCLAEKACIVDGDLVNTIDELYKSKWITKSTCERYHKIRTIGNKAVHEGNDNAYDANQAYHLLSQEVYVFADNYVARRSKSTSGSSTRNGTARKRRRKRGFGPQDLIRILIPILVIVLLLIVIRLFTGGKNDDSKTSAPVESSSEIATEPVTMAETEPASTEAPAVVYKATEALNVRSDPSTNNPRIGLLPKDSVVEYIKDYDEKWAIITYNGQEAYVAKEFLTTQ